MCLTPTGASCSRGGAASSPSSRRCSISWSIWCENRDRVVSKDELFDNVWDGRIVSESTLTSRINAARKAVDDNGRDQRLIRTIARKGFRFVGEVQARAPAARRRPRPHCARDAAAPIRRPRLPVLDRPPIAVLPFINMSGETEQEYFSDGISEDIITALSKLRWFYVIARNSSFVYKGKPVHLKQIGEELGVGYVVEGSVRKDGDRVRITAQLNDVATGSHIWAERYDRSLADVFAVQDEITQSIVAAIEPQLYAAENFRAQRKPPDSMDAWDLVMRALSHYWRVTRQDNRGGAGAAGEGDQDRSRSTARRWACSPPATASAPIWDGRTMAQAMPVAERAALAAIHADSEDAWAHFALAFVYLFNRRFDDSLAEFELALRLNPNFSPARGYYGVALAYCGRWEEGDRAARQALRLSPRDPFAAIYCGVAAYCQFVGRNYEEAIRLARESLRQRADFVGAHRVLTAAAGMSGDTAAPSSALAALRRRPARLSRWPGSQARCRSSARWTGRIIWRGLGGRG